LELTNSQRLKLEILEHGISIHPLAEKKLTENGTRKLVSQDYATTGGLTLLLEDEIYVNCPVGDWFCDSPAGELTVSGKSKFELKTDAALFPVTPLPLPAYISSENKTVSGIMTHADRVRLSPVKGCVCSCNFCDWPLHDYLRQDVQAMIEGLHIACSDPLLPPKHILISGGTPRPKDEDWLNEFYKKIVEASSIPVDIMLMPRSDKNTIERLVNAGVYGFSLNIEIYDAKIAAKLCPQKSRVGLTSYEETISQAVKLTGGQGRVRSLLLIGLESVKSTLQGVEFIARMGADPVLSPFRPAPGTKLADVRPPSAEMMADVYIESARIVEKYGVKLGPRCIPCMHNTVTFPDGSPEYYYS
jgi:uncharacterized radical SAM superfamily protein